jgi:hypothetical protein
MEIEVGDYVRTKRGTIHKIERRDKDKHLLIDTAYLGSRYFTYIEEKEDIVKHSKNIIYLIEVNDLIKTKEEKTIIHIYDNDTLEAVKEDIEEGHFTIETIVTHEMFESIEYKVEEDK